MLSYKRITAWIESEGTRIPQHQILETWAAHENFPTISCWIPSELGQKFEVCFTDDDLEDSICGYIEIDGQRCGSKFLRAPIDRGKVMRRDSVRTSETEVGYFQFADVVTTDDDEYEGQDLYRMGEIEVTVKRVHISPGFGGGWRNPKARTSFPSTNRRVVHEKDKKGIMHTVRLAASYSTGPHRSKPPLKVVPCDPIVKFVFHYAPLVKLRADGIVPPLEVKAEPDLKQEEKEDQVFIDLTLEEDDDPLIVPREKTFIDLTLEDDYDPLIDSREKMLIDFTLDPESVPQPKRERPGTQKEIIVVEDDEDEETLKIIQ
ncbi:hypothetical protein E1B28_010907 [Marasmius oreades]|uniref:DUF7918 domain-containing protein n=1 Tax=Marasmius oreades TaxID=181124 RepID=A0A9P7RT45_9AGAR|nr:uncharacterized protein E1B28_010907 [Marasmius oreades]KAG7089205.1 hypothetical protein E1B28_010907 [Marasmius oreades]